MGQLVNQLSWSASRHRTFSDCSRAYYWSYYGSWGGWNYDADPEARLAYRLKQMINMDMWAGDVVHRIIEQALVRVRDGQPMASAEEMREGARFLLNREWFESKDQAWKESPKKFRNLLEHYYEWYVSRDRRHVIRERVFQCLQSFANSDLLKQILATPAEDWLMLEDLASFQQFGVKVFAKPDLALRRDGNVVIYDWKTGRKNSKDKLQMACYALFAMERFGVPADQVRVALCYLKVDEINEATPSIEELEKARSVIGDSLEAMRGLLRNPDVNEGAREDFPVTSKRYRCDRCPYLEMCLPELSAIADDGASATVKEAAGPPSIRTTA